MIYKHVFGPVPSRRLGISLGVDLVPHKTCTSDCIYCECGPTTHLTVERREYVPFDAVTAEVNDCLGREPTLDYVTFSGAGEPTLHSRLGDIAAHIKSRFPGRRTALLTNGVLFGDPRVRGEASGIDLVAASIDAGTQEIFEKINRPHPKLRVKDMIAGLEAFRKGYSGQLWVEVFIAGGINDSPADLEAIRDAVARVNPDRIQINTLDRPGTEPWVKPADSQVLQRALQAMPGAELIAKAKAAAPARSMPQDEEEAILAVLRRRPCTIEDMARSLGMHEAQVRKHIALLLDAGRVESLRQTRGIFFKAL